MLTEDRTPTTVRMVATTCSVQHRAPDGGVKFPEGLVVAVGGRGGLDPVTARRWLKNGICEPFEGGVVGDVVTAEERTADAEDLEEQIARLERLRDRAREIEAGRLAEEAARGPVVTLDRPIGTTPYRTEIDPMAAYDLPDDQVERLKQAGFSRPDIVDAATDEDVLEVEGISRRTLGRLRHRGPGGRFAAHDGEDEE